MGASDTMCPVRVWRQGEHLDNAAAAAAKTVVVVRYLIIWRLLRPASLDALAAKVSKTSLPTPVSSLAKMKIDSRFPVSGVTATWTLQVMKSLVNGGNL